MIGKISTFGGPDDDVIKDENGVIIHDPHKAEGVACYEHDEADSRKDLFYPRSSDLTEGVFKRLRAFDGLYFAYRFSLGMPRNVLQVTRFKFVNTINQKQVICSLVDWGPNEHTGRTFDLSPYAASQIGVVTDDIVYAEEVIA